MKNQVLYIGQHVKLATALLSLNFTDKTFNIVSRPCVSGLEKILSEKKFEHLICEYPLPESVKLRIAENFPELNCLYLSEKNVEKSPDNLPELISEDVKAALNCITLPIYYKYQQTIIACNIYFSQLFGLLPEELVGQNVTTLLPAESLRKIKPLKTDKTGHDIADLFECEMRDISGNKREYLIHEDLVDDGEHKVGILFDVVEINSVKRAVERERTMLRATADASSDLIFFKDLEGRFIGCNKQFEKFVGLSETEIIGKKNEQLFAMKQALTCQTQDALVMSSGNVCVNDEFLTYHNGQEHYISMQKVPLRDKNGQVQGLIAIGRDITEQSLIQKQLKIANIVFENSRNAILVTDENGIIISLNRTCTKISGYSKNELLNNRVNSLLNLSQYRQLFVEMELSLRAQGQWQGKANFHRKSGELGYFWLQVYEITYPDSGLKKRVYSITDLTKNKYDEEKIHYLSKHDTLTGLNNRIALFNHLEAAIARANYKQASMGVLFIEIKGVKDNELYGHAQSDLVIKHVAKMLKQSVCNKDIIARIADDQFVLVVEELEDEQVVALVAQKIAQQFSAPINIEALKVNLSISIGISICPDDGVDLETILSHAEAAMIRSKNDRTSSYHFYTNELTVNSTKQIALEKELKFALENEQFELYYQPQYDLTKHQIVALECFIRWHHPVHGILSPNRFMVLAEQSGLIIELGLKMFEKVARQAVSWHRSGVDFGRISLRLSKVELSQIALIGNIQKILLNTQCRATWFECSIDESLFSSDVHIIQENLANLNRIGIALTVDGFGAERSVLYSIDKLNIDKFKISKHFIQGVPGYLAGEAMVKSVFVLAKTLGIDVVGEGIQEASLSHRHSSSINGVLQGPMKANEVNFYLRCHKRQ